jgi:hypothetical protein
MLQLLLPGVVECSGSILFIIHSLIQLVRWSAMFIVARQTKFIKTASTTASLEARISNVDAS